MNTTLLHEVFQKCSAEMVDDIYKLNELMLTSHMALDVLLFLYNFQGYYEPVCFVSFCIIS